MEHVNSTFLILLQVALTPLVLKLGVAISFRENTVREY